MDALDLDPGEYRGTYKLIGGRPALDFVNTESWPGTERGHDWLDSAENLQRWLQAMDLPAMHGRPDLQVVRDVRAALAAVLRPLAHDGKPARSAMTAFNRYVSGAAARRVVDPDTFNWTWKQPEQEADMFAPVILDAAELIADGR
ncbi:MAG TPA: ABATE domain-containing protein, partial [Gammaproteobacteria bacterium]